MAAALLLQSGAAAAQDCPSGQVYDGYVCVTYVAPPASRTGHFPRLVIGVGGGFSALHSDDDLSNLEGALYPEARTYAMTRAGLFHADGLYNLLGTPLWGGHAGYVFTHLLGGRTRHKLNAVVPATETSPGSSTTWNYQRVPSVYGIALGAGAFALDEVTVPTIDVGFTWMSPEYETSIAYAQDLDSGSPGLRWRLLWGFPIGRRVMAFRIRGDHFFGGDAEIKTTLLFSLEVSTGIGTNTNE